MASIAERVIKIVAEEVGVDPGQVGLKSRLREDLDMDSLDGLELMQAVELEFGIELSETRWAAVETAGQIVDAVEERI